MTMTNALPVGTYDVRPLPRKVAYEVVGGPHSGTLIHVPLGLFYHHITRITIHEEDENYSPYPQSSLHGLERFTLSLASSEESPRALHNLWETPVLDVCR